MSSAVICKDFSTTKISTNNALLKSYNAPNANNFPSGNSPLPAGGQIIGSISNSGTGSSIFFSGGNVAQTIFKPDIIDGTDFPGIYGALNTNNNSTYPIRFNTVIKSNYSAIPSNFNYCSIESLFVNGPSNQGMNLNDFGGKGPYYINNLYVNASSNRIVTFAVIEGAYSGYSTSGNATSSYRKLGNVTISNCSIMQFYDSKPVPTTTGSFYTTIFGGLYCPEVSLINVTYNDSYYRSANSVINKVLNKFTEISMPLLESISMHYSNCGDFTYLSFTQSHFYCPNLSTYFVSGHANITTMAIGDIRAVEGFAGNTNLTFFSAKTINGGVGTQCFKGCTNLSTFKAYDVSSFVSSAFYQCYNLISLDLRSATAVPILSNINTFNSTPLYNYSKSAGKGGSIYVPASLYSSGIVASNGSNASIKARIVSV